MTSFLHLFRGELGRDPRPTRFAAVLQRLGTVTTCAYPARMAPPAGDVFVELPEHSRPFLDKFPYAARLLLRDFEPAVWNDSMRHVVSRLRDSSFSAIICHSLDLLPVACALRERPQNRQHCRIVMDAREYYPRQNEDSTWWRIFFAGLNEYLCRRYLPQADLVFTVSPGLQRGYADEYGVECALLPSYPFRSAITPHPTGSPVRCVHHGVAAPGRKLENMIETMRLLGGAFTLDFMLMPTDPAYIAKLLRLAERLPQVRFLEPVPMPDIPTSIAAHDIGLFLLEPNTFNHRHALPNKLFEFIQARLAVAVSPTPDMADVVRRHGVGVVADDFTPQTMAYALKAFTPEAVDAFKAQSHLAADQLCWERNEKLITEAITKSLHGTAA